MHDIIAGIDVHKRVLMVVVGTVSGAATDDDSEPAESIRFVKRRFGTTTPELLHLIAWLQQQGVQQAVMESTAQYWKPVWLTLEGHFRLSLAQAWSNRAPRGKKTDFKDAQRLVRRHVAGELTLSFVPDAAQRQMRTVTRRRTQLTRDRVRIQNQLESLLEETRIKLSSVVTDLFGSSGLRILTALGKGETDPAIWAMARHLSVVIWKILHQGAQYEERGLPTTPQAAKRRMQRIKQQMRAIGYAVEFKPLNTEAVPA